jgi:hypothetical protein
MVALSSSMALAPQDGSPAQVGATITRGPSATGNVTLSAGNLPAGLTATFEQPGAGNSGGVSLQAASALSAGNYTVTISASDGSASATQNLEVVVAIAATVGAGVDTTQGVNGKINQVMSTSFQPAEWDYQFFQNHTGAEPAQLNTLGSQHIRIQFLSQAIPMKANSQPQQPADWDFIMLDDVVQPILSAADHSPEMQIAVAPPLPGMLDSNGHLIVNSTNLNTFATYCANLVRYYNTGGFTWGGKHFQSASANKITWWGIFNEYNINGLTPSEYVQVYDTVVPAMLAVDSTIKFSALELSDFDYKEGDPRNNLPTFVSSSGGVTAQVNVASTHFYSSCNQTDTDAQLMNSITAFVNDVKYFYHELQTRSDLANVPVWVTENNVNADFSNANGNSTCNPSQKFVTDQRGSSTFFAAWRPYVFSQLGKAGSQALYHWDYDADAQFGEVDYGTGAKYLSYWVDYWLARLFPAPPGGDILDLTLTETASTETVAAKFSDGSVVLMIADIAVHSPIDNNGAGDPRTTIVDISALGNFSSATQLTIDKNTDVVNGPAPMPITVAPKMSLTLGGYGVTFVTLKP